MNSISLITPQKITLKDHPELNEHWLQDVIANIIRKAKGIEPQSEDKDDKNA